MNREWIEVRSCMWLHEAEFFKSVLEAAGIAAAIPDEFTLGISPGYANMFGGVRVLVRPENAGRAREVLDSAGEVAPDPTDEGGSNAV